MAWNSKVTNAQPSNGRCENVFNFEFEQILSKHLNLIYTTSTMAYLIISSFLLNNRFNQQHHHQRQKHPLNHIRDNWINKWLIYMKVKFNYHQTNLYVDVVFPMLILQITNNLFQFYICYIIRLHINEGKCNLILYIYERLHIKSNQIVF